LMVTRKVREAEGAALTVGQVSARLLEAAKGEGIVVTAKRFPPCCS